MPDRLLVGVLPIFASELVVALIEVDEQKLADQVKSLKIAELCGCPRQLLLVVLRREPTSWKMG